MDRQPETRWRASAIALADGVDRLAARFCEVVVIAVGSALLAMLAANVGARYALEAGGFRFAQELPEQIGRASCRERV